jgi:hypothetical protein
MPSLYRPGNAVTAYLLQQFQLFNSRACRGLPPRCPAENWRDRPRRTDRGGTDGTLPMFKMIMLS